MSRPRTVALVVVSVAVVVLGACTHAPKEDALVDALMRSGVNRAEATCAAKALYDHLPAADIARITERGGSGVIDDTNKPDEAIDVARQKMAECRRLAAPTSTTVPTTEAMGTSTTTTTPGSSTTTDASTIRPAD